MQNNTIAIQATILAPIEKVWELYNTPEHITKWNNASPDWHSPSAENDLRTGGSFKYRMEAKDGSAGFDFEGVFDLVQEPNILNYTIGDRRVEVSFKEIDGATEAKVIFEMEHENPEEMQRQGWQAILDNFKKYVENN